MVVVDTSSARMQQEFGGMGGFVGMGRAPRRNPFRRNMYGGGGMDYGGGMGGPSMGEPSMSGQSEGGSSMVNVRVNKMD